MGHPDGRELERGHGEERGRASAENSSEAQREGIQSLQGTALRRVYRFKTREP